MPARVLRPRNNEIQSENDSSASSKVVANVPPARKTTALRETNIVQDVDAVHDITHQLASTNLQSVVRIGRCDTPDHKQNITRSQRAKRSYQMGQPIDLVSSDEDSGDVSQESLELGVPYPPCISEAPKPETPSPPKRKRLPPTRRQPASHLPKPIANVSTPVVRRRGRSKKEGPISATSSSTSETPVSVRKSSRRRTSAVSGGGGGLQTAKERFHASAVPKRLPCRDDEYATVYAFVESNLRSDTSGCLYISGVPGTGKTATANQVITSLESDHKLPEFNYVEVNGMRLTEPNQVFCEIYRQLVDENATRISPQLASQKLDKLFDRADVERPYTVLLVDELDLLCTRKQHILYQLFDWATRGDTARLTVLAIANTLDLPERLLTQRVTSRLGMSRLCFQPYDHKQIEFILMSRLEGLDCVSDDALQFASRKVAAVSGDLRKALDICKRAIELAIKQNSSQLRIIHIQSATKELASAPRYELIRQCSVHQRHLLRAAVSEYHRTGHDEMDFSAVYRQYEEICRLEGTTILTPSAAYLSVMYLSASAVLTARPGGRGQSWSRRLRLSVAPDDITFALKSADNRV